MNLDTRALQKAFTDISNYIYMNDGVLKDRVFSDVVRLIAIKIQDEVSGQNSLLSSESLVEITPLEADKWSEKLLKYSIAHGLELGRNPSWSIKPTSILWAARQLGAFRLSEFPADAKGEAFQALVLNNLRGDRGEYFTPQPLVSAICRIANLNNESRIIDPACGSGGFLYGAYREGVNPENLFGSELSDDVGRAAQLRVQLLGGNTSQIRIGDAFRTVTDSFGEFDAVLMNPPFGSRIKIDDKELLSQYELPNLDRTNQNPKPLSPEILFLELALHLVKKSGIVATVIPDGVVQNSSARYIREWISKQASVEAVISAPSVTFQPYGTGVKTSLLVLKKGSQSRSTYFGISNSVGYDPRGNTKHQEKTSSTVISKVDEDMSSIADEAAMHVAGKSSKFTHGFLNKEARAASRWDAEYFASQDLGLLELAKAEGYVALEDLVEISNKRLDRKAPQEFYEYVALSDVDSRTSQIVNVQHLSLHDLPSRATYVVSQQELITATSGASTGTRKHVSAIVPAHLDGAVVSSGFAVLRSSQLSRHQILGLLRSDDFLRQVLRLRTGHAIPSISQSDLGTVLVPPLSSNLWAKWGKEMSELENRAISLIEFAESTRGGQLETEGLTQHDR